MWGASHFLMEPKYDQTVLLNTLSTITKQVIAPKPAIVK